MTAMIDISKLPAPAVVKAVNFDTELDWLLTVYTEAMQQKLDDSSFPRPLVSDPAYQILSTVAYRLGEKRQEENEACLATMLAYAIGSDLDHIGFTFGVERLLITAADETQTPTIPAIYENDDRFRLRIQMAMESWTTAGSRGSYEYAALTASAYVIDVYIDRPKFERRTWESLGLKDRPGLFILGTIHDARIQNPMPGHVSITLLIDENADQEAVKQQVVEALDQDKIIPMTDIPVIVDSEIITYTVDAEQHYYPGPSTEPSQKAAEAALQEYTEQNFRLGHDIAISGLHKATHQAEVQRIDLNISVIGAELNPEGIPVQPWQAAKCTGFNVTVGERNV